MLAITICIYAAYADCTTTNYMRLVIQWLAGTCKNKDGH